MGKAAVTTLRKTLRNVTIFTRIASAEASESDSLLDINTWIEHIQECSRLISGVVLILGAS
jgi:hypothetical protein